MLRQIINLIKSLLLGITLSLCLLSIDHMNRVVHPHLSKVDINSEYLVCLIMLTLPFLAKNKNFFIISACILFIGLVQLIYFGYFGVPLSPMDISLFFINVGESLQAFTHMIKIIYFPLVAMLVTGCVFYYSHTILASRWRCKYAWILLTLELCAPVPPIFQLLALHHGVRHNSNRSMGDYPDMADNLWASAQKTLVYYLGYTLPHQLVFKNNLVENIAPSPLLREHAQKINLIVVMESLTSKHISAYNYARNTTPFLNSLRKQSNVIFKNGISAGVCTDVSLSMFFNSVLQPDAAPQIASAHGNLFKMAKENGFETYFISTQGTFFLNVIKTYLLLRYIDHFADAAAFGATPHDNVLDENLLSYFKKQNFKKPVFMVLHQRGSHFPYNSRYPPNYAFYTAKTNNNQIMQINDYDNSIRYTDALLASLTKTIIHKTQNPTILIMTSDHGESLGENGIYGHNNLREEEQFHVPIVFIALNGAKLDFLIQKDKQDINSAYMSHYELSKVVSYLLGYQIEQFSTQKNSGYVVTGNSLAGIAGYNQITFNADGKPINHYN